MGDVPKAGLLANHDDTHSQTVTADAGDGELWGGRVVTNDVVEVTETYHTRVEITID